MVGQRPRIQSHSGTYQPAAARIVIQSSTGHFFSALSRWACLGIAAAKPHGHDSPRFVWSSEAWKTGFLAHKRNLFMGEMPIAEYGAPHSISERDEVLCTLRSLHLKWTFLRNLCITVAFHFHPTGGKRSGVDCNMTYTVRAPQSLLSFRQSVWGTASREQFRKWSILLRRETHRLVSVNQC